MTTLRADSAMTGDHAASPVFAAKITGVGSVEAVTQRAIETAMDDYAVCVLGQQIEDEHQVAFARFTGAEPRRPNRTTSTTLGCGTGRFSTSQSRRGRQHSDENDAARPPARQRAWLSTVRSGRNHTWSMLHA
jgi:hypothetical protein